jgi:DNA-binding transcriptional ArsR family regulator
MNQEKKISQVTELLKALAHYDRVRIIILLSQEGPMNVSALIAQLSLEQSGLSHHLIKMRDRGILVSSRRGKQIYYSLSDLTLIAELTLLLEKVVK